MRETEASHDLREAYALPAEFALAVEDRTVLAWRGESEAAVRRVAADPAGLPPADVAGRAPLGRLAPEQGPPILVRPYRKGGVWRWLRGRRFRGGFRPLTELALTAALEQQGVPVAHLVGAVVRGDTSGWDGWLLLREETGAQDLLAWSRGTGGPAHADPAATLTRAGAAVRALHDAGVRHPDLHAKNLLVTVEGAVLVLDLDRATRASTPLPDAARVENLARFERFLAKQRLVGAELPRWDPTAFYAGYGRGEAAGSDWMARALARRGTLALRKLWWRLSGAGA